jgi:hypothetical protein
MISILQPKCLEKMSEPEKGKRLVTSNIIKIPDKLLKLQQDVILSMDGITVNLFKFLMTISHEIYYRMAQYVMQTNANKYKKCLNKIKTLYKQGGFNIKEIHCNNQF